jgi:hypothetical protein
MQEFEAVQFINVCEVLACNHGCAKRVSTIL